MGQNNPQSKTFTNMLRIAAPTTLVVFCGSAIWLIATWLYANRTNDWIPLPAVVVGENIKLGPRQSYRGWDCTVNYSFNGNAYTKVIDQFPFGATEVYVDPDDPTSAVGRRGATIQLLFIPLIAVVGSGLFGLVLALIAFSPVDD